MQSIEIRHRSTSRTWWIPESPRTHLRTLAVVGALVLASVLRGQELLWEVHSQSGVSNGGCLPYFGDYDHDGSQDLLVVGWDYRLPYPWPIIRVLSGTDGRVLTEMLHPYYSTGVQSIGDFDGDSVPDIALGGGGFIEVWSLVDKVRLLRFPLPVLSGPYGST
ncbi:MAG TPA: hypothetical protein VFZ65_08265, partial [Planctomycetota bacterium]|nr:hypothetical protein [Planctomycetota bacterium]